MSVTGPIVIGRVYDLPSSSDGHNLREALFECHVDRAVGHGSDLGSPDDRCPFRCCPLARTGSVRQTTRGIGRTRHDDGSLSLPLGVCERNSVQLRHARPKNGLVSLLSTAIQLLSLKPTAPDFVVARTGVVQLMRCRREVLTMIETIPFMPGKNAKVE
jgi:hypothetical protein